jgi:acyl transferase domain-containing protein
MVAPRPTVDHDGAVAIVGMSARLPGSPDLESFLTLLETGACAIEEVPATRWDWRTLRDKDGRQRPRWGGFLTDVDRFDARFFKVAPIDAEGMDPQHRLFLEQVWRALEDGAQPPSRLRGRAVGVFVGAQFTDYAELLAANGGAGAQGPIGNALAMAANRVSYLLDLHGPSETIDTACSSSLVAIPVLLTDISIL